MVTTLVIEEASNTSKISIIYQNPSTLKIDILEKRFRIEMCVNICY